MNTWGEAMQAIGAIREEVRFLRQGIDDLMAETAALEDRVKKLETSKPSPTHDGRIVVDANEWERLKRIEKAAIGCFWHNDPIAGDLDPTSQDIIRLREALTR